MVIETMTWKDRTKIKYYANFIWLVWMIHTMVRNVSCCAVIEIWTWDLFCMTLTQKTLHKMQVMFAKSLICLQPSLQTFDATNSHNSIVPEWWIWCFKRQWHFIMAFLRVKVNIIIQNRQNWRSSWERSELLQTASQKSPSSTFNTSLPMISLTEVLTENKTDSTEEFSFNIRTERTSHATLRWLNRKK
jgi:hypothetical protein